MQTQQMSPSNQSARPQDMFIGNDAAGPTQQPFANGFSVYSGMAGQIATLYPDPRMSLQHVSPEFYLELGKNLWERPVKKT